MQYNNTRSKITNLVSNSDSRMKSVKRKDQRKQLAFFAGELEKRQLLATFSYDNTYGILAIESDIDNETLSIVATSDGNYTISSDTIFTGDDISGNLTGNGTLNLAVSNELGLSLIQFTNNPANSGTSFYFGNSAGNFTSNLSVFYSNSSSGSINVANDASFTNDTSVNLTTTGNLISIAANLTASGTGKVEIGGQNITISGEISAPNGVIITAETLEISGNISASTNSVDISTISSIDLGTETAGRLSLTNAELNRISALGLTLASTGVNVTVSSNIDLQNVNDLSIYTTDLYITNNLTAPNSLFFQAASLDISGNIVTANSTVGSVTIWGQSNIDLGSESPGNLSLTNSEINRISTRDLTIFTFTDAVVVSNSISYSGNISLSSELDLIETSYGSLSVAGTTELSSGSGSVICENLANDFGIVSATALGNISLFDRNAITLGGLGAFGLSVNANGPIIQSADSRITGTASFNSTSSITLDNVNNDFTTVVANGTNIVIVDGSIDGLILGPIFGSNLTVNTSAGNITQSNFSNISGGTSNFISSGTIELANISNNFGTILANGTDVSISDINSIILGCITASNLTIIANGSILQSSDAVVTNSSNFTSSSTILLNQPTNNLGNVTSNGSLEISNGTLNSLIALSGNVLISGGTINAPLVTSVNLNQTGGTLNGLRIDAGTANLSAGTFHGEANVVTGLLLSSINLDALSIGSNGTANISGGSVGPTINDGSLNLTGGSLSALNTSGTTVLTGGTVSGQTNVTGNTLRSNVTLANLSVSGGTANLTGGSAATTDVSSGSLLSAASLGDLTVSGGSANLTSGSALSLTQTDGTVISSANITGDALLLDGTTTILSSGRMTGNTTVSDYNIFTSNGSLNSLVVNFGISSEANLTGGTVTSLTNNGGTIFSSANITGNLTIQDGTTTINSDGSVTGTTNITAGTLSSTGNLTAVIAGPSTFVNIYHGTVGSVTTAGILNLSNGIINTLNISGSISNLTDGRVTGVVNLSGGTLLTSGSANLSGTTNINNGTATLAGTQSGSLNINGSAAYVTVSTPVIGVTTVTLSNSTQINTSTGNLTINGIRANLTFGTDSYNIGATTVSANSELTVPVNTTLASLTQSNGTLTIEGNVTSLSNLTGGILRSNGLLGNLSVGGGTANITGGTIAANISVTNGTAYLNGSQPGNLTVNGIGSTVIIQSPIGGLTTLTSSCLTTVQANLNGGLLVNGDLAHLYFDPAPTLNIGATTVSANASFTVPINTTLASLAQSNGTLSHEGNITGLTNLNGGTLNSIGVLSNLTIGGGTANLTSGSANITTVAGGTLLSQSTNIAALVINSGSATVTGGLISSPITGAAANNITIENYAHSLQIGQLSAGNLTVNLTSGAITQSPGSNLTVLGTTNLVATGNISLSNSTNNFNTVLTQGSIIQIAKFNGTSLNSNSPSSGTFISGTNATFAVAVTGNSTPLIQWQTSVDNGVSWNNVPGATSAIYSFITAAIDSNNQYRSVSTNTLGSAISLPATLTVITNPFLIITTADSGAGSLRNAINYASTISGDDEITFSSTLTGSMITLLTPLVINDTSGNLSITGLGISNLTISGGGLTGIFNVQSPSTISNLTLSNGTGVSGTSPNIKGGAIYSNSSLTLLNVAINQSTANLGSSIYLDGGSADITTSNIANSIHIASNSNLTLTGGSLGSTLSASNANMISITNYSQSIELGSLNSNSLTVNLTSGAITQSSGSNLTVTGTANFVAPGNITLSNTTNNFNTISASGTNITVSDVNTLTLGNIIGNGLVQITASDLNITGNLTATSSGSVQILPISGTSVNLGTESPGNLSLTNSELNRITSNQLSIGNASTGFIVISSTINPATAGSLALSTNSQIQLGANVTTSGAQLYSGPTLLTNHANLATNNGILTFGSTLNGPYNLGLSAGSGNITFSGSVGTVLPLTSLKVLSAGIVSGSNLNLSTASGAGINLIALSGSNNTLTMESTVGETVNTIISGSNSGNISSSSGTSIGSFTGIHRLIGTSGNDTFRFINNSAYLSGTINGGSGTNAINYSGTTKPLFVNLGTGQATGVTSTTSTGVISNIQDVFGGTGNDYLTGSSAANVMDGGAGDDTIMGLGGNDILVGNYGSDSINGGAGSDILIGGYVDFVVGTLQEGLQSIMGSWKDVNDSTFNSLSNTLGTASSSQFRLVGDTNLASTYLYQTVFNDQAVDRMTDIASSTTPNWFFATERVTKGNDVVQAGTTFTVSKKTITSKTSRSSR